MAIRRSFAVLHWNWAGRRKEVWESAKSAGYLNEQNVQNKNWEREAEQASNVISARVQMSERKRERNHFKCKHFNSNEDPQFTYRLNRFLCDISLSVVYMEMKRSNYLAIFSFFLSKHRFFFQSFVRCCCIFHSMRCAQWLAKHWNLSPVNMTNLYCLITWV